MSLVSRGCLVVLLALTLSCQRTEQVGASVSDPTSGIRRISDKAASLPVPPSNPSIAAEASSTNRSNTAVTPKLQLAGAHILIAYKGAMRASPAIQRSKAQALQLAKKLALTAQGHPEKFVALAEKYSDGPSGPQGGDLGNWIIGQMVPAFDAAVVALKVGEVSPPVETPFGYHVIKRNPLPPLFAGSHILIAYKGALRAEPEVTRNKAQAFELAKQLAAEARQAPESFAQLARNRSDGPSRPRGGSLGSWPKGRMIAAFDQAMSRLKIGEVSDPVETPFGYHVMKREDPAHTENFAE